MLHQHRILGLVICVSTLSACSYYERNEPMNHYPAYSYERPQLYPEGYESTSGRAELSGEKGPVVVPETYHVGVNHSPTPHTDRDREWVTSQKADGYTIELANGDKASEVANSLYKAPKNERMAEVKYQRDGKTYYKGLYGTYPSYEAAQQAFSALPPEVKTGAGIKTWGSVQNGVE